jgi:hypothetical protein
MGVAPHKSLSWFGLSNEPVTDYLIGTNWAFLFFAQAASS